MHKIEQVKNKHQETNKEDRFFIYFHYETLFPQKKKSTRL